MTAGKLKNFHQTRFPQPGVNYVEPFFLFIYVIALSGGIVLEEAVDLSCDRLLMNEFNTKECTYKKYI